MSMKAPAPDDLMLEDEEGHMLSSSLRRQHRATRTDSHASATSSSPSTARRHGQVAHPYAGGGPGKHLGGSENGRTQSKTTLGATRSSEVESSIASYDLTHLAKEMPVELTADKNMAILQAVNQLTVRSEEGMKLIIGSATRTEQMLSRLSSNIEKTLAHHQEALSAAVAEKQGQLQKKLAQDLAQQTSDLQLYMQSELQLATLHQADVVPMPPRKASDPILSESGPTLGALLEKEGDGYLGAIDPAPRIGSSPRNSTGVRWTSGGAQRKSIQPVPRPSSPNSGTPAAVKREMLSKLQDSRVSTLSRMGSADSRLSPSSEVSKVKNRDVVNLVRTLQHEQKHLPNKRSLSPLKCFGLEPERSGLFARLLRSLAFERALCLVLVLHAVFVGYLLEVAVDDPSDDLSPAARAIEFIFLLIYGLELTLKLIVHRLYFFVNEDWQWNIFDILLVAFSWLDALLAISGGHGFSATTMRVMRLLRVAKVFRALRVVMVFKELRVMLICFMNAFRALFWSIVVLVFFIYLFALIFINGTASYLDSDEGSVNDVDTVLKWYGSISKTMETLYLASTGGISWHEIGLPVQKMGSFYYGVFLFFIAFIIFAALNILTGIYVESAIQTTRRDIEGQLVTTLEEEQRLEDTFSGLFSAMDSNSDGQLAFEEFFDHVCEGAHWAYFTTLGLEIGDVEEFYALACEYSRAEAPDAVGFVRACRRFRRNAKFTDVYALRLQVADLGTRMNEMKCEMLSTMAQMLKDMDSLQTACEGAMDSPSQDTV